MFNNLLQFDVQATRFINEIIPHNNFLDIFFSFFSLQGASFLVWVLVIILIIFIEEKGHPGIQKKDKLFLLVFFLSFLLAFVSSDVVLKNIFQRHRPPIKLITQTYNLKPNTCPVDFSFPSTHAVTAFASAGILASFDKKRKCFYYIIAILISFSRIYLGCHYLIDVIVGGLLGYYISNVLLLTKGMVYDKK